MNIIVTGASQNHSKSMLNLIDSVYKNSNIEFTLFVYDLGLTDDYKNNLITKFPQVKLRTFDYSKYPEYFNIKVKAGEYAWKPALINEVLNEISWNCDVLLWLDAGDLVTGTLEPVINAIKNNLIFSPRTEGDLNQWCYKAVHEYFNIQNDKNALNFTMKNGAILGFYIKSDEVKELVKDFYKYAQIKEAICPEGSSRKNHRQDQALFTVLAWFFYIKCKNNFDDNYYTIRTHCDCD
jgi:hypothetical protein